MALVRREQATNSNRPVFDPAELINAQVEDFNAQPGNLQAEDGVDCPICRNRGQIAFAQGLCFTLRLCECTDARRAYRSMERSGMKDLLRRYSMASFTANTPWHQAMQRAAEAFLDGSGGEWFFVGGQVGCGKTHLCTAICKELMRRGQTVRYMLWRDESARLKALVGEAHAYHEEVKRLKTVPVLYIDDLFKTQRTDKRGERGGPSTGDLNLAFEIINARYNHQDRVTIISCEWLIDDLMAFDEGVASRLYERSRGSCIEIERDPAKNYRLRRQG